MHVPTRVIHHTVKSVLPHFYYSKFQSVELFFNRSVYNLSQLILKFSMIKTSYIEYSLTIQI